MPTPFKPLLAPLKIAATITVAMGFALTIAACAKPEKPLNFLNFGDYIGANSVKDFTAATKIAVNYGAYATNEELLAKLSSTPGTFDLAVPSDYMVKTMIAKGMLEEIDKSALRNLGNIDPRFAAGKLPFDPDGKYAIPYHYGLCGFGVNTAKVKEPITSFKDLLKPEYKGRVIVLDDMRYTMGAALRSLGYSANSVDPVQLDAATALMRKLKENLKAFDAATFHERLGSGEVDIVFGYNVGILQVAAKNPDIKFVVPDEGGLMWIDSLVIPKGAPNKAGAHQMLDFVLDAKNGAAITNTIQTATANAAAAKLVDGKLTANPGVFPTDALLKKAEYVQVIGDNIKLYEQRWVEIKK